MKLLKYGAIAALLAAPGLAHAQAVAADGLPFILESVDLSDLTATIATMGVLVVAIALTFKGIRLAKRLIGAV